MAFPALPGLSRGRQGEEAAEETGSPTLALPGSRPSPSFPLQLFSRGPQSRRSKTASSMGDTGPSVRQLVWFGFSDGHGARYRRGILVGAGGGVGRGQRVRSSAPRRHVSCGWCGEVRPRRHLQLEECSF